MTSRILRTEAALRDLNEQAKFIQRDSPNAAIRFLYVIFYRPIEHGVEVVRVLHAARDIAAIFEDET